MATFVAASGLADAAWAAGPAIRFHIEPKRYSEALLDLAQQANVTLIGAAACDGATGPGLTASLTLEQALARLLADAPCSWRSSLPAPSRSRPVPTPQSMSRRRRPWCPSSW